MANDVKTESGKVVWLPPHFSTAKVVANRTAPLPDTTPTLGSYKEAVRSKSLGKSSRYLMLHLDIRTDEFKISSPHGNWSLPVTREAIMKSINEAGGCRWATVSLTTQNVRLDREELLGALHTLEAKSPKLRKKI